MVYLAEAYCIPGTCLRAQSWSLWIDRNKFSIVSEKYPLYPILVLVICLVMVALLICWSFMALAWRLPVFLLQQTILRQALLGIGYGGARTAVRFRLVPVSVVVARWSKDLFVIIFTYFLATLYYYRWLSIDRSNFSHKKVYVLSWSVDCLFKMMFSSSNVSRFA